MNDITAKKQQIALLETEIQGKLSLKETLLKEIEELEKNKRFEPKLNDFYYIIGASNEVYMHACDLGDSYLAFYKVFNCFRTEEEAQLEADRILLLRELRQFAKECNGSWIPNWNEKQLCKYGIVYDANFRVDNYYTFNCFIGGIAFRERIYANHALEKFKDRLHILINN